MVSNHCSIINQHAKFEPVRTNRTGDRSHDINNRSVRREESSGFFNLAKIFEKFMETLVAKNKVR